MIPYQSIVRKHQEDIPITWVSKNGMSLRKFEKWISQTEHRAVRLEQYESCPWGVMEMRFWKGDQYVTLPAQEWWKEFGNVLRRLHIHTLTLCRNFDGMCELMDGIEVLHFEIGLDSTTLLMRSWKKKVFASVRELYIDFHDMQAIESMFPNLEHLTLQSLDPYRIRYKKPSKLVFPSTISSLEIKEPIVLTSIKDFHLINLNRSTPIRNLTCMIHFEKAVDEQVMDVIQTDFDRLHVRIGFVGMWDDAVVMNLFDFCLNIALHARHTNVEVCFYLHGTHMADMADQYFERTRILLKLPHEYDLNSIIVSQTKETCWVGKLFDSIIQQNRLKETSLYSLS
jgi:hypothetical protein